MNNTIGNNRLSSERINNYVKRQEKLDENEILYLLYFKKNARLDEITLILDLKIHLTLNAIKRLRAKGLIKYDGISKTYSLNAGGVTNGECS